MEILKERIRADGIVVSPHILKASRFLNHQIDVDLLDKIGEEIYRCFSDAGITRIITIEASGIAVACAAARCFTLSGNAHVPVSFAKKHKGGNIPEKTYSVQIRSFTQEKTYDVILSQDFVKKKKTTRYCLSMIFWQTAAR